MTTKQAKMMNICLEYVSTNFTKIETKNIKKKKNHLKLFAETVKRKIKQIEIFLNKLLLNIFI